MSRRIALPGADELFRSTGDSPRPAPAPEQAPEPALRAVQAEPGPVLARGTDRDALEGRKGAAVPAAGDLAAVPAAEDGLEQASAAVRTVARRRTRALAERRPSGRERHEEKITVYVSADELMDLEQARLTLRGDFGLSVDRGRVVREALAVVLADLEAKGESSILVRRLHGR